MKKLFLPFLLLCFIFACDDSTPTSTGGGGNISFDRGILLTNWADNIIIPTYQDFSSKVDLLETATATFTSTPNEVNLASLRTAWQNAYINWQNVSIFEIGKAEELFYRDNMNIYPTNTTLITDNINSQTYNLSLSSNRTAQGFPALDYLLNGLASTDADIVAFYTTHTDASKYKNYLTDLVSRMKNLTDTVLDNWTTTYRDSFVASTGSSVSASVDKMTNDFIFYYEKTLRAGKVAIPAGIFSSTGTLPGNVEAFYKKDISKALLLEALQATQNFFNGKTYADGADGIGLADYLKAVKEANGGEDLASLINQQFEASRTKINALDANFVSQINSNNTLMLNTYDELQKNTIQMKVKMMQSLNISVDYVDADGD